MQATTHESVYCQSELIVMAHYGINPNLPPARRNDRCPCGSGRKYKVCCKPSRSDELRLLAALPDFENDEAFLTVANELIDHVADHPAFSKIRFPFEMLRQFMNRPEQQALRDNPADPAVMAETADRFLAQVEHPELADGTLEGLQHILRTTLDEPAATRATLLAIRSLEIWQSTGLDKSDNPLGHAMWYATLVDLSSYLLDEVMEHAEHFVAILNEQDSVSHNDVQRVAKGLGLELDTVTLRELHLTLDRLYGELHSRVFAAEPPVGIPFATALPLLVELAKGPVETPSQHVQLTEEDELLLDAHLETFITSDAPPFERILAMYARRVLPPGLHLSVLERVLDGDCPFSCFPQEAAICADWAAGMPLSSDALELLANVYAQHGYMEIARRTRNLAAEARAT